VIANGHLDCRDPATIEEAFMDRKLVSRQQHELEYLAHKHGVSVERVREISKQIGSRSRKKIEAELSKSPATEFFEKSE
jgi:hypothetical protein